MFVSSFARRLDTALRECGERVEVIADGAIYHKRAIVQNTGKNFMRKYDDDSNLVRALGRARKRDKLAFLPYIKSVDKTDGDVRVVYRGKRYLMIADGVLKVKDEPVYIWAILSEIVTEKGNYYSDEIGDNNG